MVGPSPAAVLRTPIPAAELSPGENHRIVLFGAPGTGKTAQILTLPRPIFVYTFEGSALATLHGASDIHVLPFFPRQPHEASSLAVQSVQKGGKRAFDFLSGEDMANRDYGLLYSEFARDAMARMEQDWWRREGFVTLALDGLSTLGRLILSRVRVFQAKVDSQDGRTDYMQAGFTLSEVFGYLSTQTPIFFTALHTGTTTEEKTGRTYKRMELPGGARALLPTISTICWRTCLGKDDSKNPPATRYCAQTFPDREGGMGYDWIRPGPFTVPDLLDLTIDDWSRPEEYGIGKLIRRSTLTPTTTKK